MNKSCLHCHQKLGFLQAVRGELFCSSDHREAYFQAEVALAFERVTSFDKPKPVAVEPPEIGTPQAAVEIETPQPVLEVMPAPIVAAVTVPEVRSELRTEALLMMLTEATELVPVPELQEPIPAVASVVPEPVSEPVLKEDTPMPVVMPEPPGILDAKPDVKEEVVVPEPAPAPMAKVEPRIEARVELKEEIAPIPFVAPEPPSLALAQEDIKEEAPAMPIAALAVPEIPEPKIPEAKEPPPIRVAAAAPPLIKIPAPKGDRKTPKWVAPGIAACLAIVALSAIFFGPSKKTEHSLLPSATPPLAAAEKPVPAAVPVPAPEPAPAPPVPVQATPIPAPVAAVPAPAPKPVAPPAPAPAPAPVKPAPAPVVAANTSGAHHAASVTVKETAWVAVCSDGKEVLATMMSPGDEQKINFIEKAIVRTGNAGGIAIAVDGKSVGSLGPPGGLRVVELNPQVNPHGFHLLALKPGENGACVSN